MRTRDIGGRKIGSGEWVGVIANGSGCYPALFGKTLGIGVELAEGGGECGNEWSTDWANKWRPGL